MRTIESLVFDITDLITYAADHPISSDMHRVAIGLISAALQSQTSASIRLAAFSPAAGRWTNVPTGCFERIGNLPRRGEQADPGGWKTLSDELRSMLRCGVELSIPLHSTLVNLGTASGLPNYFLAVRQLRQHRNIRYVQFVHDLVPAYASDTNVSNLPEEFTGWLRSAYASTDLLLTNSAATLRGLVRASKTLQAAMPPARIVRLDVADPADGGIGRDLDSRIAAPFAPRTWASIWGDVINAMTECQDLHSVGVPSLAMGRFHFLGRDRAQKLQQEFSSGEIFRSGTGWGVPEDWGCPVKGEAFLVLPLFSKGIAEKRLYMAVRGIGGRSATVIVSASTGEQERVSVHQGQTEWMSIKVTRATEFATNVRLKLYCADTWHFGLVGFLPCEDSDYGKRLDVLEWLSSLSPTWPV